MEGIVQVKSVCLSLRACLTLKIIPLALCPLWHTALPSAADFDKYHICLQTEEARSRRVDPYTCWLCLSPALPPFMSITERLCSFVILTSLIPHHPSCSAILSSAPRLKSLWIIKLFTNQHCEDRAGSHLQTLAVGIYFGLGVYAIGLKEVRDGCVGVICM